MPAYLAGAHPVVTHGIQVAQAQQPLQAIYQMHTAVAAGQLAIGSPLTVPVVQHKPAAPVATVVSAPAAPSAKHAPPGAHADQEEMISRAAAAINGAWFAPLDTR